jgi:glycosyltransferase involved in cell wall biosynthesis
MRIKIYIDKVSGSRLRNLKWYIALKQCPLFDEAWYQSKYPDVANNGANPLWHYLANGWKESRFPSQAFDSAYYIARYPDIANIDMPPLVHYWLHGRGEGRYINSTLDLEWLQHGDKQNSFLLGLEGANVAHTSLDTVATAQSAVLMSVIIPTYNREKFLPGIIDAWKQVDSQTNFNYEIIFSDDGSTDGSVAYLESVESLPITILRNAHGGASSARNAAIRAAKGERLLIVGDDIFPEPDMLNIHAGIAQQFGPAVAVLSEVDWHKDLSVSHLMHHITEIGNEQFSYNRLKEGSFIDFRHFYTCNLSVDRQLIQAEEVLFDERFNEYGFEDIELGYRLALRGMRIYYTNLAKGWHYHPYNLASFCRRQTSAGRMSVVFCEIHPSLDQLLGIRALKVRVSKQKAVGNIALWQARVDQLQGRCAEYELLVATLPKEISIGVCDRLSAIYSRLFRAMYDYGVLTKLGNYPNALALSMSYQFDVDWESYWLLLERNNGNPIKLNGEEIYDLNEAINAGSSTGFCFSQDQLAVFDELMQIAISRKVSNSTGNDKVQFRHFLSRSIYYLKNDPSYLLIKVKQILFRESRLPQPIALTDSSTNTVFKKALPALILDDEISNPEKIIELFCLAFGDTALVYKREQNDLLTPILDDGKCGEPINVINTAATIFYWPTTSEKVLQKDQLLGAFMAIVENGLSLAVVSHNLVLNKTITIGTWRDSLIFSQEIAQSVFEGNLNDKPFTGKIVRLLPAIDDIREQQLGALLGATVDLDHDGFFKNNSTDAIFSVRYKAPYLPLRLKTNPVVFVFPIFLAVGGVERNTVEIMRQLRNRYDFIVITMERLRPEQGSLAAQAIEVAAQVIEMSEIARHKDYLRLLTRLKINLAPDLVWVCNGSPWFCDNASGIRQVFHNVPIIDQEVYDVEQGWITRYAEAGIQSFDHFIAVNQKIEARFKTDFKIDPSRIHLIYSAVDTARIRRFKQSKPKHDSLLLKFGLPAGKQIFTFVGRLTQQKRPIEFLRLAKERLKFDDEFFVLVGDGELASETQTFIKINDLQNVKCIPYIENTLELNAVSDGIIFTSAYEGLPIAMLEALAMGVPAFATDVGAIADVLTEYDGGVVIPVTLPASDVYKAFENWLRHRSDYVKSLVKNEQAILERFSSKNIAQQYVTCWESAMKQYGRKITQ